MNRHTTLLMLVCLMTLGAATVAFGGGRDDRGGRHHGDGGKSHGQFAVAELRDADGRQVGRAWFKQHRGDDAVTVFAHVRGLPPGFHGFHVHTTGECEPPDFMSAGGHLNPTGASHGSHAGDLPTLLVNEDGSGMLAATTDRFSLADLRDDDGSAVMVHELADNYANIPERYGGPDAESLSTGDAGSRIACGVVR
jgi:superoxide dismutase, Cu-Zn family